eukprot:GHUV01004293.1.p1 GENE.GHUV01004293.1~~GHUV01004293.1.p1  ORF type:complete len:207 (+),score=22.72 GHUV01004293.1:184-804(+)
MATISRQACASSGHSLHLQACRPLTCIKATDRPYLNRGQRGLSQCYSSPPPVAQLTQQPKTTAGPPPVLQQTLASSTVLSVAALLATAGAAHAAGAVDLYSIADIDATTAHKLETFLRPLFTVFTFLYIIRIPMTWYPSIDGTKLPWVIAYAPTEPVLKATRNVIPLVGGVDVTPIVWVALISFFNEILLGPQGILMLIQRQTGGL